MLSVVTLQIFWDSAMQTWKFNWAVFKVCQHHPFPLFNNLGSIPDVPPEAQVPEGQVGGVSAQTRKVGGCGPLSKC